MDNLALPSSPTELKSFWSRPEGKTAIITLAVIGGLAFWFWGLIVPFIVSLLVDTLHMVYLAGLLTGLAYLVLGKRPRLMFRVVMRAITGVFVSVYPIEIIEDHLVEMKKRREKMNEQIGLVNGGITELKRQIEKNRADAATGYNMASQAKKMAGAAHDETEQLHLQLQMKVNARKAERREQANLGYQKLLEKLQKVYGFLTRYATNIDYFIEDNEDLVKQKKIEYKTTKNAFSAVSSAMAVIKGNATEEDIYDQAMEQIESTVSQQLGIMDDLQRVSQNFMDGMDVQTGAVDDAALKALDAFEHKLLTSGDANLNMVTQDKQAVPVLVGQKIANGSDFGDLLQ